MFLNLIVLPPREVCKKKIYRENTLFLPPVWETAPIDPFENLRTVNKAGVKKSSGKLHQIGVTNRSFWRSVNKSKQVSGNSGILKVRCLSCWISQRDKDCQNINQLGIKNIKIHSRNTLDNRHVDMSLVSILNLCINYDMISLFSVPEMHLRSATTFAQFSLFKKQMLQCSTSVLRSRQSKAVKSNEWTIMPRDNEFSIYFCHRYTLSYIWSTFQ